MKRPLRLPLWFALPAASLLVAVAARAEPACGAASGDTPVAIAAVSDDLDLTLADGRSLRLAGIDPPHGPTASPDLLVRARHTLDAWQAGGGVILQASSPLPDRWGRIPVLLARADAVPPTAAEALLRAGLARAKPEPAVHGCFPTFLLAESAARTARLGVWADPHYAVLAAGDADGLAAQAGGMALVQGILHVHDGRSALYLALGRDRHGFVAVVSRRDAQRFAKAGLDLHDYEGTPVRLRGDLDIRFGPRLRITDPDAVESLEPGSIVEEARGSGGLKDWTVPPRPR